MKDYEAHSPESISLAAADWLIRRDRGFSPAEQDEFFQWLAADPRHGESFARQQRTWKDFNLLAQWRPEHSAEPNPDLLARRRTLSVPKGLLWSGALAIAASVTLLMTVWAPWKPPAPAVVSTAVGSVARDYTRRVLEDGSELMLHRGAAVEVAYTPTERRVRLVSGEAGFAVAKNPARPFIVRAGGVDVRAVGTAFNIRLGDKSVEVLVTEGKVRVDDAVRGVSLLATSPTNETPVLSAGQKVVVEAAPIAPVAAVAVSPEDIAKALAWQPHLLEFNSQPLSAVVAEFNRSNATQIVLGDPSLANLPIVASFRSDNAEGFVRLLEQTSGIRAERTGDTITLRPAK